MTPLCGLLLAGGRSSRMGFDKGLINYHGRPQREHLFDLLGLFCTEVHTSCKQSDDVPESLNPLPDRFDINSPLNGILSAFYLNAECAWLTIPVDMPFVDKRAIQFLIAHRDESKIATCFWNKEIGSPDPLFTIWEPEAKNLLIDFYQKGGMRPRSFLMTQNVQTMEPQFSEWLLSVNTPAGLAEFKTLHANHLKSQQSGNQSASQS